MFADQFQDKKGWLGLWVAGTRKYTAHISSGFYFMAKEADVPICFVGVDWRTKILTVGQRIDPATSTKDDVLAKLQKFATDNDLANAGLLKSNASTLVWRQTKVE
jgi:hypothetical protein